MDHDHHCGERGDEDDENERAISDDAVRSYCFRQERPAVPDKADEPEGLIKREEKRERGEIGVSEERVVEIDLSIRRIRVSALKMGLPQ